MFRTRIICLCCALLAGSWANAQGVHKCRTPDGRTTYSDSPCPGADAAKPPAEPKPAARPRYEPAPAGSLSEATELAMQDMCAKGVQVACEVHRDIRSGAIPAGEGLSEYEKRLCDRGQKDFCRVYCLEAPSSSKCLEKTGKASGAGWYEVGRRTDDPRRARITVTIACRAKPVHDPDNEFAIRFDQAKADFTREEALPRRFATLDAAATDACEQAAKNGAQRR